MKIQAAFIGKPKLRRPIRKNVRKPRSKPESPGLQLLLLFLMLASLFGGAILYLLFSSSMQPQLAAVYDVYSAMHDSSWCMRFCASLLPTAGTGLLVVYLGVSPAGAWTLLPLVSLRCAAMGSVAAYLVKTNGKQGLTAYFAGLFPGRAVAFGALFLLCIHALRCSKYVKSCLKRDSLKDENWTFSYIRACLPALLLLLLAAVLDTSLQRFCLNA